MLASGPGAPSLPGWPRPSREKAESTAEMLSARNADHIHTAFHDLLARRQVAERRPVLRALQPAISSAGTHSPGAMARTAFQKPLFLGTATA